MARARSLSAASAAFLPYKPSRTSCSKYERTWGVVVRVILMLLTELGGLAMTIIVQVTIS